MLETIKVRFAGDCIRLDTMLKLARVALSGGEAKVLIQSGEVKLNGEVCTQRGRKIQSGDIATLGSKRIEAEKFEHS